MPRTNTARDRERGTRTCTICGRFEGEVRPDLSRVSFYAGAASWCSRCANERRRARRVERQSVTARIAARAVDAYRRARGLSARRFGVELEFYGDRYAVAREMNARGVTCSVEGYNHERRNGWKIVSDASCQWELVSPVLQGEDGAAQVMVAGAALKAAGATVRRSCGLHVHLDAADLSVGDIATVAESYAGVQRVINTMLAPSRRSNTYCGALQASELDALRRADTKSQQARQYRYRVVNTAALNRHGTVEFRQHQGTIEGEKVLAWVEFLMLVTEGARRGERAGGSTATEVVLSVGGSQELATYFERRVAQLARAEARRVERRRAA